MFSTPNRSHENQKSSPESQDRPLTVQQSFYETVRKANRYLLPYRHSPEPKDPSILETSTFMKSLYQKDSKYLDVSSLSYAFGDDEPRKPKQFENNNNSGFNENLFENKNSLFPQDLVDWDSLVKKGNQNKISKGQVTLPVLGFHSKDKDENPSTPLKEKRHSSSIRNAGNTDVIFRKNHSMSPKTRNQIQRVYSSAGKNSVDKSFEDGETSTHYLPMKQNHNTTMDEFPSNTINRKIVFMPFRSKPIKPQPLSILNTASLKEHRDSFLNLSGDLDEGDYGEDTRIKESDSFEFNSKSIIANKSNHQILLQSKDKGLSRSLINSPAKPKILKKQQINPLSAYKLELSSKEQKLTSQEKTYQRRMDLEKVKQVYQKGIRIQKPNVKGIEHLILLKKSQSHNQRMQEYKRRRGLDPNALIFCFNSRDWHIKNALEKFGWIENPNVDSVLFNLKWTYRGTETDYQTLSEGQYLNHFGNNQELTTKSGLIRSLIDNAEYGANTMSFFPRGYELGNASQINDFREDFEKTALGNLLKNLWKYIKTKVFSENLFEIKAKFWVKEKANATKAKVSQKRNLYDEYKRSGMHRKYIKYVNQDSNFTNYNKVNIKGSKITRRMKTFEEMFEIKNTYKWWENWEEDESLTDFRVDIHLVLIALRCLRTIIRQQRSKIIEDGDYFGLDELAPKIKYNLLMYSKWEGQYELIPEQFQKTFGTNQKNWKTPSFDIIYRIYKYYTLSKAYFPQYCIEGSHNIWIIKPLGNSRGSGIFLTDSLEEALESGTQNKSRIIQKYIEKPLILYDFPLPSLDRKKFDLRQWVLVTSVNPLTVYMFSSCYLRICSADFDIRDIKNNFKHLTNFSVNKEKYKNNVQASVCELDPLKEYLKKTRNINWDIHIKPQIINIILETLLHVSPELEQKPGCFELYGFDILLDERCRPWLLEVNLSPACAERTPWLVNMLNKMAIGMLELVLPLQFFVKQKQRQNINSESEIEDEYNNKDYSWDLIFKGEEMDNQRKDGVGNANLTLEVVGSKLNWKKDQGFDQKYNWYLLFQIIRKNVKTFLFKRRIQRRIETKKAKIIQKYVRGYLARKMLWDMKRLKALEIFKKYMIIYLKKRFMIELRRNKAAIKIQRNARRRIKYIHQKREKAVSLIQRIFMKQKIKEFLRKLKLIKAAVVIQRQVKIRLNYLKERRALALSTLELTLLRLIKKQAIKKLVKNNAVIKIQSWLRQLLKKKNKITNATLKFELNPSTQAKSNFENPDANEIEPFTNAITENENDIVDDLKYSYISKPIEKRDEINIKQTSEYDLDDFEQRSFSSVNSFTFISERNSNKKSNKNSQLVLEVYCDLKLK